MRVAQFEVQPCFEYRIEWSNDCKSAFVQLDINAPQSKSFRLLGLGLPQVPDHPDRLFVSPDGHRLGITFSNTVVFLPIVSVVTTNEFAFAISD